MAQPHQLRLVESNITVTGKVGLKGFSHWAFFLAVGQLGLQFDVT